HRQRTHLDHGLDGEAAAKTSGQIAAHGPGSRNPEAVQWCIVWTDCMRDRLRVLHTMDKERAAPKQLIGGTFKFVSPSPTSVPASVPGEQEYLLQRMVLQLVDPN